MSAPSIATNLVWDDSRIEECAEVAERAVIDFLESFSNGPDSLEIGTLAAQVRRLVERKLAGGPNT